MRILPAALIVLWLLTPQCLAGDVFPSRMDRAPNNPYAPEEARQRMTVPAGFAVDLVASEPEIVNPIAMAFDDRGRIWVTQSVEYPRKSAGPGRDMVKIIEAVDHAGHATKVTTFVDDLNVPTGIAVGYGGVWVLNSPDLLFYRERDGKPVSKEVVISGFGRTDFHELPSSLTWGPDGWLYGLNGVFNQRAECCESGVSARIKGGFGSSRSKAATAKMTATPLHTNIFQADRRRHCAAVP